MKAQKKKPNIVSVHLSPEAKSALDNACQQRGMTIKSLLGRLIEWFNGLNKTEQSIVLGQVEQSDVRALATLIGGRAAHNGKKTKTAKKTTKSKR